MTDDEKAQVQRAFDQSGPKLLCVVCEKAEVGYDNPVCAECFKEIGANGPDWEKP